MSDVFIPQDLDYPALQLDIDRMRAGELGLDQKEVVDNIITALTSNQMIAPSYWIDPKTGNNYMLTVQYPEDRSRTSPIWAPSRCAARTARTRRASKHQRHPPHRVSDGSGSLPDPRAIDIYVRPHGEDLGRIANPIDDIIARHQSAGGPQRYGARNGAGHAIFVQELRLRPLSRWCCYI